MGVGVEVGVGVQGENRLDSVTIIQQQLKHWCVVNEGRPD